MELINWKKGKLTPGGNILRVNKDEAISLINSLTNQIMEESPNSGRHEYFLKDGKEFSIAVHPDKVEVK